MIAVLLSCQKEQLQEEITTDLTSNRTLEISNTEKYFGVFASYDLDMHGEIRIHKEVKGIYIATVNLLNGEILHFKGAKNNLSSSVPFHGERGSFSLDFSENSDLSINTINVDNKDGYIKLYKETSAGGGILFGDYVAFGDPTFAGFWDAITFGAVEPTVGLPLIDDILISHKGVTFLTDETPGLYEPFMDFCLFGVPLLGPVTDGLAVSGVGQVAIFSGKPCFWTMVSPLPGIGLDPITCIPLPPGADGFWDFDGKSGVILRAPPPTPIE